MIGWMKMDLVLVARVTLGTDATLAALLTAASTALVESTNPAVQVATVRLVLIPDDATVHFALGIAADANAAPLPATGIDIPISTARAKTLHFFSAGTPKMTVMQFV